ncbi:hypothetical protein J8273_3969 [Carpediemonas membranifera]|uniref:Uncharacterized protein n=1 Tax=Carpediemonas membranifera TaxID=201153 RepID=A0A8J6AY58_9EUKA|nr:hypothetical protein J8273_3969 [Carpediemonas membranifera]|eukprot:KAG9394335.1 hypothetical protein J8273_3969 [Carpediemonas membranifera]
MACGGEFGVCCLCFALSHPHCDVSRHSPRSVRLRARRGPIGQVHGYIVVNSAVMTFMTALTLLLILTPVIVAFGALFRIMTYGLILMVSVMIQFIAMLVLGLADVAFAADLTSTFFVHSPAHILALPCILLLAFAAMRSGRVRGLTTILLLGTPLLVDTLVDTLALPVALHPDTPVAVKAVLRIVVVAAIDALTVVPTHVAQLTHTRAPPLTRPALIMPMSMLRQLFGQMMLLDDDLRSQLILVCVGVVQDAATLLAYPPYAHFAHTLFQRVFHDKRSGAFPALAHIRVHDVLLGILLRPSGPVEVEGPHA